jgi:hypothetical protein
VSLSTLSAEEIAEHQLLAAIRLWREQDYLPSLTLAGAAEEILGKRLRKLGQEPSFNQLRDLIVAIAKSEGDDDPSLDKTVGDMLNKTRNELKHYGGDDSLTLDLRSDCLEMLERAIANYQALTGTLLTEAMYVWENRRDPNNSPKPTPLRGAA